MSRNDANSGDSLSNEAHICKDCKQLKGLQRSMVYLIREFSKECFLVSLFEFLYGIVIDDCPRRNRDISRWASDRGASVSEWPWRMTDYTRKAILKKAVSRGVERASETNLLARFAINSGPSSAIGGQERDRVLGQLEHVNLQPRKLMP